MNTPRRVVLLDVDGTCLTHRYSEEQTPWPPAPDMVELENARSPLGAMTHGVAFCPDAMRGLRALVEDGLIAHLWWSTSWLTAAWQAGIGGWRTDGGHPAGDPTALDELGERLGLGGVIGYPPADAFVEPPDRYGLSNSWADSRHWKVLLAIRLSEMGYDVVVVDDDLGAGARRYLGDEDLTPPIGWVRPAETALTAEDVGAVRRWAEGGELLRLRR